MGSGVNEQWGEIVRATYVSITKKWRCLVKFYASKFGKEIRQCLYVETMHHTLGCIIAISHPFVFWGNDKKCHKYSKNLGYGVIEQNHVFTGFPEGFWHLIVQICALKGTLWLLGK